MCACVRTCVLVCVCGLSACVAVCLLRFQPMELVERIQAIAQNVSDMAMRVEQILQKSKNAATGAYTNLLTYFSKLIHLNLPL